MLQTLIIISIVIAVCLIAWLLARSASRSQARRAFTSVMSDVHEWAVKRNDLRLTANALGSLRRHRDLLLQAHSVETDRQASGWRQREFLLEYARCEARHREICDLNYPDNDMYEQAMELQEAIDALDAKRGTGTGGTGDD